MNRHASMNRVYRLIWSGVRGAFIPVAETARGRVKGAKRSVIALAAVSCAPNVFAQTLPQGATVRSGSASIASTATRMDVTTGTSRTAIDWTSFSIGAGDQVIIDQPTSASITVNRVTGASPSQVFGELSSNGQVVLANPNGVWFGPQSRVDVAGIVATTSRLNDSGLAVFAGGGALSSDAATNSSSIVNQGAITVAQGGLAGLVAPSVRNSGVITARRGSVTLAAGAVTTIDFYGDGLINLVVSGQAKAPATAVDGSPVKAAVDNSGGIISDGGTVRMTANVASGVLSNVIDMSGVVEARGVTTTGGTVELLGGSGSVSVAGTVNVSGQAGHRGGTITVQAGTPAATQDGIADVAGSLDASSAGGAGGQVAVSGRIVTPSGAISVDGASAGAVHISATTLIQSGAISADGTSGTGGTVALTATGSIIQSSYASTTADSAAGSGGVITLDAGPTGRAYSSGSISAQGSVGGDIQLFGASIGLAAAQLNASGTNQGGQILVGGGLHGQGEPAAMTTEINPSTTLRADALGSGDGGTVVVWSSSKTLFEGSASARGGSTGGDGGMIEVSSGNDLAFTGSGDASAAHGQAGTLLLDPKNIIIDNDAGNVAQFNLIDPDAGLGTGFGTLVVQLSNGTVMVTKPGDTVGGSADAGSIFYFNPTTGGLLASFQGSHPNDAIGSLGVTFLNYTNYYNQYYLYMPQVNDPTKAYLISSPSWNGGAGAVTWVGANSTVSGILSSSNSLVGSTAGDTVGALNGQNYLYLLPNDNYLVFSPNWSSGKGAVTFGTAGAALTGVVSSSNSLVGSTANPVETYNSLAGDNVGSSGLTMLTNNNFVVLSPNWNAGAGAVTFGTETGGVPVGVLGSSNSLVGAAGSEVYVLSGSLVSSPSNGYYGGDEIGVANGSSSIYPLANGSYVVASPGWHHDEGAVTVGSGTTGVSGIVSTTNSLTGSTAGIGTGGPRTGTYNGSTYYTNNYGDRNDYGGDQLGSGGITQLANGNWVVSSPGWNLGKGAVTFLPSSTTALGTGGSLAQVTVADSLVGSHPSATSFSSYDENANFAGGDSVGSLTPLPNSNYVVSSGAWNGTFGAATLMDGANGHAVVGSGGTTGETVSASNSLVGSTAGDYIGVVTPLAGSSNFVVSSGTWDNGRGEVTRVDGTVGSAGVISAANSLVGVTPYQTTVPDLGGDDVGSTIVALPNGNWVIVSPNWSMTKGAVTFELAGATPIGNISAANSLVGSTAGVIYCTTCSDTEAAIFGGDSVGGGGVTVLADSSNFLVLSPTWSVNRGAATFVNGATGAMSGTSSLIGTISASNSLVGTQAGVMHISAYNQYGVSDVGVEYYVGGDQVGSYGVTPLPNGNFVLGSPFWNLQAGALTFGLPGGTYAGGAAFVGALSSANSLVGVTAGVATAPPNTMTANWTVVGGDQIGSAGIQILSDNNFLVLSPQWSGTKGAVTWGSGTAGTSGAVSSTNSFVGSTTADMVGTNDGYNDITLLTTGDYLIVSPGWSNAKGAVTFGTPGTALTGVIASSNSLVGSTAGDAVASGGVTVLAGGDYVVNSPDWNGGVGAATWSQGTGAVTGVISSTNSILGVDTANYSLASFASTDPKAFFVTLSADGGGEGGVILAGTDPTVWDFARAQANTVTIAPSLILASLNAGTSLVLEASNDITVNSAVVANANATGALTLDAGRSVLVHANINTGDGALTLIGNDSVADGVIDAQRSAGTAVITVDGGASLSTGTGALTVDLAASTDKTYNTAGNITVGTMNGASVTVTNLGSAGGDIMFNGDITATAAGTSILLATSGEFINTAGAGAINPVIGRYLVYSADPRTNTLDGLTDPTHFFGESYPLNAPGTQAADGNIYLYSVVPVLTVTSNSSTGYGTSASALTAQVTGFIDGDTQATAVGGAASLTTGYVAGDAVGGSYAITVGRGSLASPLGYSFAFTNGNVTVTPEALSIALAGSISKTYNANATATLAAGNYVITGLYSTDSINVTQTAGTYASLNVGSPINVTATLASGNFSAMGATSLSNYVLPTGSVTGAIGAITAAPLTAVLTGATSKVYDGGDVATLAGANYQLSGLVGSQTISVSQTAGSYALPNVGTALGVSATLTGIDFTAGNGTALSNYALPTSAVGGIGAITAAPLTAVLTGTANKVYDGGDVAMLAAANYQLGGLVVGQTISVSQTAGSYASPNVGTGLEVTATLPTGDFAAGTGTALSNYTLPVLAAGTIGAITPAPLTVSLAAGSASRVYDGGTATTLMGADYQLSGLIGSQSISINQAAGTFASPNVGTALGVSATLAGGDFAAGTGTALSNYTLPLGTFTSNVGAITPAPLTAVLIGSTTKVYDGGDASTLTGANYQLSGLFGSQSINVSQTAGAFASPNVGAGLAVTATLGSGDFAAGTGTALSNYTLPVLAAGTIGAITPAPLTVSLAAGSVSRVYDGGTAVTLTGADYQLSGLVGSQTISISQTAGSYASPNVGATLGVSATLAGGNFAAGTGTALSNYTLPLGTFTSNVGAITPAPLTAVLIGSTSKVYDGGDVSTLTGANYQLSGLIGGQSIGVSQTLGAFASPNVGTGLGVTATLASGDFAAGSGTTLSNYTLPTAAAGAIGAITPAPLTVSLAAGSVSRVYDGGTAATLTGADYQLNGLVGGQSISISQATGTYASPDVGVGLGVSATLAGGNFAAGTGTVLSNYTLPLGTFTSTVGAITPAPLTAVLVGSTSKVYDGGDASILTDANYQLSGLFGDQSISISQGSGAFASPNVGTGLGVTATLTAGDFAANSGTALSNYTLPIAAAGAIGAITPAPLTVSLVGGSVSRAYNGGTAATLTGADYQLSGLVVGQSISINQSTGTYASPNVGTALGVSATLAAGDFSASSGTLLSNYTLPASAAGAIGVIAPATLTVSLIGGSLSRTYDGGAAVSIVPGDYLVSGLAAGQSIAVSSSTGSFVSDNVGAAIGVTSSLTGGDFTAGIGTQLSNYALPTAIAAGAVGAITPAALTVTANPESKIAGAANPTLSVSYSGFVGTDSVASLASPATVTSAATAASPAGVYAINASGAVDPNYVFAYVAGVLNVTQGQVTVPPPTVPPPVAPPIAPPALVASAVPGENNVTNTIDSSFSTTIDQFSGGTILQSGDIFLIGQSASFLPGQTDSMRINQFAVLGSVASVASAQSGQVSAVPTGPDELERSSRGRRSPDRDVHDYANAYLASIGLGASK